MSNYEDANVIAFEGGDTEEETKAVIAERNKAMQEHADKQREIAQKRAEAEQEALDATAELEAKVLEDPDSEPKLMGEPIVTPPEDAPQGKPRAGSQPTSSSQKAPSSSGGTSSQQQGQ